ncbi:MAG: CopG family antitoxin [Chloroflexota bacterium]
MRIPEFAAEEELAEFWDAHELTDYVNEGELDEVQFTWKPDEDTCPQCGGQMNLVDLDIDLSGNLILHQVDRYACPTCGFIQLSPHAVENLARLELRIRRYGLAGLILLRLGYLGRVREGRVGNLTEAN